MQVLDFIRLQRIVWPWQLVEEFGMAESTATWRLWRLGKQGLAERLRGGGWCLTEEAYRRLDYYGML